MVRILYHTCSFGTISQSLKKSTIIVTTYSGTSKCQETREIGLLRQDSVPYILKGRDRDSRFLYQGFRYIEVPFHIQKIIYLSHKRFRPVN